MSQLAVFDSVRLVGVGAASPVEVGVVVLVVPREPDHLAVALEGEVHGDPVEKPAIVTDDPRRSRRIPPAFFERPQRIDVEVFGRLVQQQDIGAGFEDARQVNPIPFTAREIFHPLLLIGSLEIERGDIGAGGNAPLAKLNRVL